MDKQNLHSVRYSPSLDTKLSNGVKLSNKVKQAGIKTIDNFKRFLPILLGIFLLISLLVKAVPKSFYTVFFSGHPLFDSLIGAVVGSVATGMPITSYIIGGELLNQGVGLIAITSFIVAWVTVGIVQLPAEIMMLGKKFAISRNIVSFILTIIISFLTVVTLKLL